MNCLKCNKTITKKMLRSQQVIFSSMSHSLDEDLDDEMHSGTFCNHKCFDEFMNYNKYRIISNPKTLSVKVLNFRNLDYTILMDRNIMYSTLRFPDGNVIWWISDIQFSRL